MKAHVRHFSWRWLALGGGILLALVVVAQLLYPGDRLLPFTKIDGLAVGGWHKKDAAWELDRQLNAAVIPVFLNDETSAYTSLHPEQIGLAVQSQSAVEAMSYPWYMRLVPSSLLWFGAVQRFEAPATQTDGAKVDAYIHTKMGDCDLQPKDATLQLKNDALELVKAENGGVCDKQTVKKAIAALRPALENPPALRLQVAVRSPKVKDETAEALGQKLTSATEGGLALKVGKTTDTIEQKTVLGWLDFTPKKDTLRYAINKKRSDAYFAKHLAPKVRKPAGVTRVTTRDFTETSRKNGASGTTLAADATRASVMKVLGGEAKQAQAMTTTLKPSVVYTRTYTKSSAGISATITHYATDHPGTFGVAFQELGGQGRSAAYNAGRQFTTASTYKLYVAYSTLRRVDNGSYKWSDQISGGRDLAKCFDDMIVLSDNPCAQTLVRKIGYSAVHHDVQALGLGGTSFIDAQSFKTTAADLNSFLIKLHGKKLSLKSASRDRLLSAMQRNVYRQGIPAGASGNVADKVGFLEGLLHDTAIVYSPKGTYALTILTDGSSWVSIAELTRKIEKLR